MSAHRAREQRCAHRAARILAEARRLGEVEDVVGALAVAGAENNDRKALRAQLKQVDHRMLAGDLGAAGRAYGELLMTHPLSRLAWGKAAALGGVLIATASAGMVLPVRVLFVIPGEARGSSMIFARRQAESLAREGLEVKLFHLRSRTSPWQLTREYVRFRRRVRSFNPQVIHAHFGTVTALFAAWAAPSKPLVITFRGSDLNVSMSLRSLAGQLLSQMAALHASRIVCVSRQLRGRLWWRRGIVMVLPSGVDPDVFCPEPRAQARRRLGWNDEARVVLFNAGHDPAVKRLDLAKEALALTQGLLGEVRMEVLHGEIPPERMPDLLNAADCLLLTSDQEGSPTVIQEALACNLPVISVDVGDTVERLRCVRRSAIVPREPAAIAIELARVLRTPTRSDGRAKVGEFSTQRIAGELCRIYRELAPAPPAEAAWNTSPY